MSLRLQNISFNDMRLQVCPNNILKCSSYFRENKKFTYPKINHLLPLAKIIDADSDNLKNALTLSIPVTLQ